MPKWLEKLKKLKIKDNPGKRAMRGEMTEEDMEKYLVNYKKDKKPKRK